MSKADYTHRLPAFSLRMEDELRDKLEKQAKRNGRTLTSELNYRLNRSLANEYSASDVDHLKSSMKELMTKVDKLVGVR